MLDGRQVSGTGGLLDFVRGARLAKGGRSILALPSTAGGGKTSRIVPRLGEGDVVSCPRADADIVVTEHGVARLRDKSIDERAEALIAIADPAFRDDAGRATWQAMRRRAAEQMIRQRMVLVAPPSMNTSAPWICSATRRGEERDQIGDVLGLAVAAQAGARQLLLLVRLAAHALGRGALVEQGLEAAGDRHAGMHRLDRDAVPQPELGERLGEVGDRGVDRAADHEVGASGSWTRRR